MSDNEEFESSESEEEESEEEESEDGDSAEGSSDEAEFLDEQEVRDSQKPVCSEHRVTHNSSYFCRACVTLNQ